MKRIFQRCALWGALFLTAGSGFCEDALARITEEGRAEAREALSDLQDFRAEMQKEQLPLEKSIRELRTELNSARQELRNLREAADSNDLALTELQEQVEQLSVRNGTVEALLETIIEEQKSAAANQLDDTFQPLLEEWESAEPGIRKIQESRPLISRLIDDLQKSIGGAIGPLTLYSEEGKQVEGTGLALGPLLFFTDGELTGVVDHSDPSYPKLSPSSPREAILIEGTIEGGEGLLPIDATGGAALAIRQNSPDLLGEILKAGIWIYPILAAAAIALIVSLVKWISLLQTRRAIFQAQKLYPKIWNTGDSKKHGSFVANQPTLLRPFWETLWNTRTVEPESREDLLYARLIEIRLRLTRGLAALSVIAATAPLLGLLGTVTGMITTFQRITLFGTGDPQNLSGGISEALLTTKFGLIVAIPTFLLYAYLSRRTQGTVANLENMSTRFEPASKGTQPSA